jgi:hypothetical protein
MDQVEPYKWALAATALCMMCVGFWFAGQRALAVCVGAFWTIAIGHACFGKGDLYWAYGWIWYDRSDALRWVELACILTLLATLYVIRDVLFPDEKKKAQTGASVDPEATESHHD